ncbi:hypothetical protein COT44_01980 [Candidatus Shapirobacteria bacterium CG08_land_8_20_14_0_20_39_18]|uniref:Glycosidase n=1 Tax=Candidatus Shapirobacteria bacterium CG08_land_8_20_14_0_20_39_18 TaxID=1974883 RepID=A0A2M6XDI3_9BACT|nr:MAG: hypothetical protein COT44_01980 [Candidatus Shapirobacteria bacterium CG08_land_8_20_14_0_20_39_18]PIY64907.1 MAG: hypothetical protein COY91_03955 [Candidatus Shapirobacteria bacterium CG_4_10_14_0_8_um_filter_39_15]PJE68132.1 MAG: hypothetical protein COU94_03420 [Candidatus Shapirobacteria bacterium CG10_big_fil_rev_8_21_14_0_10_38_8]
MIVNRYNKNPILTPNKNHPWEAEAVFNGCPIKKGKEVFLLYRAMSPLSVSSIGVAKSKDGVIFYNRQQLIISKYPWERFGCEDPRVTKLNKQYYIFYTGLSTYPPTAEGVKVALAISKDLKTVQEKHLITFFNAKAMSLFPEKINKKMWAVLTVHTDQPPAKICLASFNNEKELWSKEYWNKWYPNFKKSVLPLQRTLQDHVEAGAPPIKTKNGWLLIYSYIRNYFSLRQRAFSVEAVLLDLKNPFKIIARTNLPILVPEEPYEKVGKVPNIVFPSGAMVKDNLIYLYYGSADTTISLAYISIPNLLKNILENQD